MAVLPVPHSGAALELTERLAAAPRSDVLRALDALDTLAAELEPDQLYPREWVLFRLLGVREQDDDPVMLVGSALRDDLSIISERVCIAIRLKREEIVPAPFDPAEVAERWRVSPRTIDRYRRTGLVARRVVGGRGGPRVVFTPAALACFEQARGRELDRASRFSRINGDEDARLVRAAELCRSWYRWSLNETARRLAQRIGRSHEGVRQALRRANTDRAMPIFPEPGPPDDRARRALSRAARRGLEPAWIAERTGRSKASVRRGIIVARAEALRAWLDGHSTRVDFPGADLSRAIAAAPAQAVGAQHMPNSLQGLVGLMRERVPPVGVEERARIEAAHALMGLAHQELKPKAARTSGVAIDKAETALRWASLLKAALLRPHLRLLIETIDAAGRGRAETWPADELALAIVRTVEAASATIDRFDPTRGGRLAGSIGLAAQRVFAGRFEADHGIRPSGRADRRLTEAAPAPAWALLLDPWQRELSHPARWLELLHDPVSRAELSEPHALCIELRYGLGDDPPKTLRQLAEVLGTTPMHAAVAERKAERAMRELARRKR